MRLCTGTVFTPEFTVERGLDGRSYLVFRSTYDLERFLQLFHNEFADCPIVSFGQYENALSLEG